MNEEFEVFCKDTDKTCFNAQTSIDRIKKIKVRVTLRTAETRACFFNYKCTVHTSPV